VDTQGLAYKWLQKMGEGELAGMLKLGILKYINLIDVSTYH